MSWLKKELESILPVFLYFFIFFVLISWIETYLFEEVGLSPFHFVQVLVAAALIAKIFIVVDHLPITNIHRKRPLAAVVFWKTGLYWILLFVVSFAIRSAPYVFREEGQFRTDMQMFYQNVNWHLFISVQVYYLMLIFNFVVFREVAFKIGRKKLLHLFFGSGGRGADLK